MGIFFIGYLLLEIPGTLLVEKWSARKWISRIMISWGIIAAMTAFVHYRVPGASAVAEWIVRAAAAMLDPLARADLGWLSRQAQGLVSELPWSGCRLCVPVLGGAVPAGSGRGRVLPWSDCLPDPLVCPSRSFPGAVAWFFIGTPIAQIIGPPICGAIMAIGVGDNPPLLSLVGWQWVYIFWGIPAVILGFVVLARLPDWPHQARWLSDDERSALENELLREKHEHQSQAGHMSVGQALAHPKVLALAAAYFFVVTGNYGVEMYMASILKDWYHLEVQKISWLIVIPAIGSLLGQIFVGWNSDRMHQRRWHASLPIIFGATALVLTPVSQGDRWLTIVLFTLAMAGVKAFLPAFWTLPSELMSAAAAAASIGLVNSFGNLGGAIGPTVVGIVRDSTGSYSVGLRFLAVSMVMSAAIIITWVSAARSGLDQSQLTSLSQCEE